MNEQIPPQLVEACERAYWEGREVFDNLDPWVPGAMLGAFALLYLFFCNCCRQICRKAGKPGGALVWLPWLQQIPMLRAAGMSGGWILASVLPPVWLLVYIVWCFKIARARDKGSVVGLFLLLPGLQVFAFLHLAWSSGQGDPTPEERESRKVLSLSHNRRAA